MLSAPSVAETIAGPVFEGWNIGAVSVKRVRLHRDNCRETDIRRHGGDPALVIREMLNGGGPTPAGGVMTGAQAVSFLSLPYLPESICIEIALEHLGLHPDLVVCLGGETFVIYCVADGKVRRVVSSNRCAAGSGEFLVQQFQRMNMDVASGIAAARHGGAVPLASRCSVHCKSDATHKLNKGECTPADIACSLVAGLAVKIAALIQTTGWRSGHILLAGGLAQCEQLAGELTSLVRDTQFEVAPASTCLEAVGAAVAASNGVARGAHNDAGSTRLELEKLLVPADLRQFRRREPRAQSNRSSPLSRFAGRVVRLVDPASTPRMNCIPSGRTDACGCGRHTGAGGGLHFPPQPPGVSGRGE